MSQPTAVSKDSDLLARQLRGSLTGHHEDTEDGDEDFISNSGKKSGKVISFFFALAIMVSRIFICDACSSIENTYPV